MSFTDANRNAQIILFADFLKIIIEVISQKKNFFHLFFTF